MATPGSLPIDVGQYTSPIVTLPYFVGQQTFEHFEGELASLKAPSLTCRCFYAFARPLILPRFEFHSLPNIRMGYGALNDADRRT